MRSTAVSAPPPALTPQMRRFALQVQCGFAFTLALSVVMLVLQG